jgi:hypothetical protein
MGQLFEQGRISGELALGTGLGRVEIGLITLWTIHTDLGMTATDSLKEILIKSVYQPMVLVIIYLVYWMKLPQIW